MEGRIMFIENLPQIHIGKVSDKSVDWRKVKDEDNEDAPASKELIEQLGFDPDKLEDEVKDEIPSAPTGGIVYKDYILKQGLDGVISIFSSGGAFIDFAASLDLAINRINEISS